jgi:metal-responsive CopG/Arc/MetJ family transcriptional regulator
MKIKTSITLSEELVKAIDQRHSNRSEFIEKGMRAYLRQLKREERDAHDLEILNKYADELNREALETLEYSAYYNEELREAR